MRPITDIPARPPIAVTARPTIVIPARPTVLIPIRPTVLIPVGVPPRRPDYRPWVAVLGSVCALLLLCGAGLAALTTFLW